MNGSNINLTKMCQQPQHPAYRHRHALRSGIMAAVPVDSDDALIVEAGLPLPSSTLQRATAVRVRVMLLLLGMLGLLVSCLSGGSQWSHSVLGVDEEGSPIQTSHGAPHYKLQAVRRGWASQSQKNIPNQTNALNTPTFRSPWPLLS
jgi:hypothetical protein